MDTSFAGSPFAAEQQFTVAAPRIIELLMLGNGHFQFSFSNEASVIYESSPRPTWPCRWRSGRCWARQFHWAAASTGSPTSSRPTMRSASTCCGSNRFWIQAQAVRMSFMPARKPLLRYSLSKITRTSGPHLVIRDSVDWRRFACFADCSGCGRKRRESVFDQRLGSF